MRTSHKEKVREANQVAQKEILKETLGQVTQALSDTLEQLNQARAEVELVRAERARLREENRLCEIDTGERIKRANAAEANASKIKEEAIAYREETSVWASSEILRIEDAVSKGNLQISKNNGTIKEQEEKISTLSEEVRELDEDIAGLTGILKKTRVELNALEAALVQSKGVSVIELETLEKNIREKRRELAQVTKLVDDEKEKIKKPMESLKRAEALLDHKKRDMDIYRSRTITQFRKAFPGQQIHI